jgi:hypothetical protein
VLSSQKKKEYNQRYEPKLLPEAKKKSGEMPKLLAGGDCGRIGNR